jgi:hypothetical protein
MSNDEYRRLAADAQRQADRARNDDDRASWLRIAQGWLSMIRKRGMTSQEAFDAETAAKRTDAGRSPETSQ